MIPVILYLLFLAYSLLAVGLIFENNMIEKMASFMLLLLCVELLWNGIGDLNNTLTWGIGIISFGLGAYHLVRDFTVLNFDKKVEDEE